MSGDARDFNNIETRAAIKFFFLLGKAPKEIHAILHLQPRRNGPTWASNVLITHPILRIWPRRTHSLD